MLPRFARCLSVRQALAAEHLASVAGELEKAVHRTPENIDRDIAKMKLEAMNIGIDTLTEEQQKYLSSWELGT